MWRWTRPSDIRVRACAETCAPNAGFGSGCYALGTLQWLLSHVPLGGRWLGCDWIDWTLAALPPADRAAAVDAHVKLIGQRLLAVAKRRRFHLP